MLKCGFLSVGTGECLVVSELGSGQERLIWPQHKMVQRWETRAGRRSGGCYSSSVFTLLISDTNRHCQSTWSSYNLSSPGPPIPSSSTCHWFLKSSSISATSTVLLPNLFSAHCALTLPPTPPSLKPLSWGKLYISRADPGSDFQVLSFLTTLGS